jgi:hypothetical protein
LLARWALVGCRWPEIMAVFMAACIPPSICRGRRSAGGAIVGVSSDAVRVARRGTGPAMQPRLTTLRRSRNLRGGDVGAEGRMASLPVARGCVELDLCPGGDAKRPDEPANVGMIVGMVVDPGASERPPTAGRPGHPIAACPMTFSSATPGNLVVLVEGGSGSRQGCGLSGDDTRVQIGFAMGGRLDPLQG